MAKFSSQISKSQFTGEKSIPEYIINGSIVIDSVEAFKSILKQFPDNPILIKAYSDFLLKNNLFDLAAKNFGEASQRFIEVGNILQAVVSKKLQWRIQPPDEKAVNLFLDSLKNGHFDDIPLKIFFNRLSQEEMLAIINCFVRARLPAGTVLKRRGDSEDNLYFIVSGTLKDSLYPSLETKVRVHRPSDLYLTENQFFGDIYPFNADRKCESDIETTTQAELAKISKANMIQLCKKYPNIELAVLDLFKIRQNSQKDSFSKVLRKADRYHVPIDMILEMYPNASKDTPVIVDGYSSDISIGGICVIVDAKGPNITPLVKAFEKQENSSKIWVGLPAGTMQIKVLGRIAWSHSVILEGIKTLVLGIQFEKMSPRLRGMLFMFANSLQNSE